MKTTQHVRSFLFLCLFGLYTLIQRRENAAAQKDRGVTEPEENEGIMIDIVQSLSSRDNAHVR